MLAHSVLGILAAPAAAEPELKVGSKKFTESVVLAELLRGLAAQAGARVEHVPELGGTQLLWKALLLGEIDLYPEYTGTLREEIFGGELPAEAGALEQALNRDGVEIVAHLGFNNSYALGINRERAAALKLETVSDLRHHPELRFGFTNEFMDRADGWPGLRDHYELPQSNVRGLDHDLAYRGLEAGQIDVIDVYTTDAEIEYYELATLRDDRRFFPEYQAVVLGRSDLAERAPAVVERVRELEGRISAQSMSLANAQVKLEGHSEAQAASELSRRAIGSGFEVVERSAMTTFLRNLREHLLLVSISLAAAIAVAIPAGIWAARSRRAGRVVLGVAGVLQTIPSLALLVFMIPLFGIGTRPALAALFLYSLLPIIRNTYEGLRGIPDSLREAAEALGLEPRTRLLRVELPMASRSILAGIKTSAVINIGTATLGALIGAGGFGQPILTGIRLDDTGLILQGAVPAALLALFVQGLFDLADRWLLPAGLQLERGRTNH